jgi:hypothetical protein
MAVGRNSRDGFVQLRIEGLPDAVKGGNALRLQHAQQLTMNRLQAFEQRRLVFSRVLKRAIEPSSTSRSERMISRFPLRTVRELSRSTRRR